MKLELSYQAKSSRDFFLYTTFLCSPSDILLTLNDPLVYQR